MLALLCTLLTSCLHASIPTTYLPTHISPLIFLSGLIFLLSLLIVYFSERSARKLLPVVPAIAPSFSPAQLSPSPHLSYPAQGGIPSDDAFLLLLTLCYLALCWDAAPYPLPRRWRVATAFSLSSPSLTWPASGWSLCWRCLVTAWHKSLKMREPYLRKQLHERAL